ncbi:unnamed protein product, partial [Mesorhabditis belari]|uniref:Carboxylic ester hydrolase n=1 Tax=Mesorhabditis belari TaxID=2138241 RepID=A0AAF3F2J1_9BILA
MRLKKKEYSEVQTHNGVVRGQNLIYMPNCNAEIFLGIPYAKPPTDHLRFKKPEPPDSWNGTLKCMKYRDRSVQKDHFIERLLMNRCSEDCLYLNIFAPPIEKNKKYPVFFYIHGGGFMMDSPSRYAPEKLCRQFVARDVLLVTIQYRLGFLGFFSTGDDACPGNMGMFDQVMALDWVKENISAFGGDPNDITVGGQSAGGVSTDLLSLSPYSRTKFHRKICMGGSSFCHWAVAKKEIIVDYCTAKARALGWTRKPEGYTTQKEENYAMIDWLRTIPASKFGATLIGEQCVFEEGRLPLGPVYDEDFLPRNVRDLRDEAPKMASIVGVGQFEALAFAPLGRLRCDEEDIDRMVNVLIEHSKEFDEQEIRNIIKMVYGSHESLIGSKDALAKHYIVMASDIISNHACWRYIKYSQNTDVNTYAYSFDYMSRRMFGLFGLLLPFHGPTHGSEVVYLLDFNLFHSLFQKDKIDMKMGDLTADYFVSFIRTGNPNLHGKMALKEWPPVEQHGSPEKIFSLSQQPAIKNEAWGSRMRHLDRLVEKALWVHELLSSSCQVIKEPSTTPITPIPTPTLVHSKTSATLLTPIQALLLDSPSSKSSTPSCSLPPLSISPFASSNESTRTTSSQNSDVSLLHTPGNSSTSSSSSHRRL